MRQKAAAIYFVVVGFGLPLLAEKPPRLVFLGDSLTAGYGLPADQAYPALVQQFIRDAGWPWAVVNSGISGDTTAGGLRRMDWLLRQPIDVLVIILGANDGLRGFAPELTARNLAATIEKARTHAPDALIVLGNMRLPSNLGDDYVQQFETVFTRVAAGHNVPLMPFLLEDVAAKPELNLPDGIHPNTEGQRIVAAHVWEFLEPLLAQRLNRTQTNATGTNK